MINLPQTSQSLAVIKGRLNYFVAFDIGGEVDKATLSTVFKTTAGPEYSKPIEVGMGTLTGLIVSNGRNEICRVAGRVDVFAMGVGIACVELEIPEGMPVQDIITAMHSNGVFVDGLDLNAFMGKKMGDLREQLKPYTKYKAYYSQTRKYSMLKLESYTPELDQSELKTQYGAEITRFLSGESTVRRLHGKEIADKLSHDISYYDEDLFLVSYEAAFVKGCDDYFIDLRQYLELAIALAYMYQVYDWRMDAEISEAFKAIKVAQSTSTIGLLFNQSTRRLEKALLKVSEIKLDILDNLEDVMNPLKVTSDWYYQGAYDHVLRILKVKEYESVVTQKIDALEDLYSTAQEISYSKITTITEVVVILLIAFEAIAYLPHLKS
jgi:hypothetical protein